jgi:hypothetical protein
MNKCYKTERVEYFKETSGYKSLHVKCIHYLSYTDSLSMFRRIIVSCTPYLGWGFEWPYLSQDLSICYFFVWWHVKDTVFNINRCITYCPKQTAQQEVFSISTGTLLINYGTYHFISTCHLTWRKTHWICFTMRTVLPKYTVIFHAKNVLIYNWRKWFQE